MKFELDYVEKLMKIMESSTLTELELDDGESRVVLKNEKQIITAPQIAMAPAVQPIQQVASAVASATTVPTEAEAPKKGKALVSPMVGTFYKSPSPTAAPFIEVGKSVAQGEVVCIIEAMKLMNEIESEFSGKVIEICVEDGQSVEYGQVLMYIE